MRENRWSAADSAREQTKERKELPKLPDVERETESESEIQKVTPAEMTKRPIPVTVQTESATMQTESEAVQTESATMQTESEAVQTESATMQTESEAVQTEAATMQTESEAVQTESATAQTESITVQPESALSPELVRKLELGGVVLLVAVALALLWRYFRKKDAGSAGGNSQTPGAGREPTLRGQSGAQASASGTGAALTGVVHGIGGRDDQQDSYGLSDESGKGLWQEKGLFAVLADGMGGLSGGGAVSRLVVSSCLDTFSGTGAEKDPADLLLEAVRATNIRVNGMLGPNIRKSGSTLVQALVRRGKLYFLTVGDSRVYLYRGGRLLCLNRPHVYAEELALAGINGRGSLDQVHRNSQKDALTSFVGAGELAHLDRNSEGIALVPGDKILLATDGVFGTLEDWQMEQALEKDADAAARELGRQIEEADKEYQDNYTAVILTYPEL